MRAGGLWAAHAGPAAGDARKGGRERGRWAAEIRRPNVGISHSAIAFNNASLASK